MSVLVLSAVKAMEAKRRAYTNRRQRRPIMLVAGCCVLHRTDGLFVEPEKAPVTPSLRLDRGGRGGLAVESTQSIEGIPTN
jgi:hypothetical protein